MFSESYLGILNLDLGYQAYTSWTWVPAHLPPPPFSGKKGLAGSWAGFSGNVAIILWISDSIHRVSLCLATSLRFIFLNSQPGRSYKAHLITGVKA